MNLKWTMPFLFLLLSGCAVKNSRLYSLNYDGPISKIVVYSSMGTVKVKSGPACADEGWKTLSTKDFNLTNALLVSVKSGEVISFQNEWSRLSSMGAMYERTLNCEVLTSFIPELGVDYYYKPYIEDGMCILELQKVILVDNPEKKLGGLSIPADLIQQVDGDSAYLKSIECP